MSPVSPRLTIVAGPRTPTSRRATPPASTCAPPPPTPFGWYCTHFLTVHTTHRLPRLLHPSPRLWGGIPHPGLLTVVSPPPPPPPRQVHASDYCTNLAALSNARVAIPAYVPPPPPQIRTAAAERTVGAARRVFGPATTTPSGGGAKHTVAFVMSDGDNLQWILGPWTTDERWWGATERGSVPLGWTLSPAVGHVAPYAALER